MDCPDAQPRALRWVDSLVIAEADLEKPVIGVIDLIDSTDHLSDLSDAPAAVIDDVEAVTGETNDEQAVK